MFRRVLHAGALGAGMGAALAAPLGPPPPVDLDGLFRELDQDGDGRIATYEGADALLLLLRGADRDGDGGVDIAELEAGLAAAARERAEDDGGWSLEDMVATEAADILAEDDRDGDGRIASAELHRDDRAEMLAFADADGGGFITRDELEAALLLEERPATFAVEGEWCVMTGVIGPSTPGRVLELVCEHPEVKVIEMRDVQGSVDDEANARAARRVRKHGLATHVPRDGVIASGGVDFFLAGAKRTIADGARLGVHSWDDDGPSGVDLPRDDPEHRLYLDFYAEMGLPAAFYWFTLEAAGPDDIHWMTPAEVARYGVLTDGE